MIENYFSIHPNIVSTHPHSRHEIVRESCSIFDPLNLRHPRNPIPIHEIRNPELFHRDLGLKIFHLPLKLPHSKILIPKRLEQFTEVIQATIDFEASINPRLNERYIFLTLDQTPVKVGNFQRQDGWHLDDWQWGKFPRKQEIEHSYLATSGPDTTEFAIQEFDIRGLVEWEQPLHLAFNEQFNGSVSKIKPFHLYLIDGLCVHRTPVFTSSERRTFLRITISPRVKAQHLFAIRWQSIAFGLVI